MHAHRNNPGALVRISPLTFNEGNNNNRETMAAFRFSTQSFRRVEPHARLHVKCTFIKLKIANLSQNRAVTS